MLEENKKELYALVLAHMERYGQDLTEHRIWDAHDGRPDGTLVTNDNLHLFRQFRNTISSSPRVMVHAALESRNQFDAVFPDPNITPYDIPKKVER
jgi:hypothetical protein